MMFAQAMGAYGPMLANLGAFLDADTLAVPGAGFGAKDVPGGVRYPTFAPGEVESGRAAFLSPEAVPAIADPDDPGVAILGLIDDAVPLGHPALRANGRSRVAAAWLMGARAERPAEDRILGPDLTFGAEWRGAAIDSAVDAASGRGGLDEDRLLRALGQFSPSRPPLHVGGRRRGHGIEVAGLMTGTADPAHRPILAVGLPPEVTQDTRGALAPFYILVGIVFLLHRARRLSRVLEAANGLPHGSLRLPVVINLSWGTMAGRKDGSGRIEHFMDAVSAGGIQGLGPIEFTVPMGNGRMDRARAVLAPGEGIGWRLPPDDATPSMVEIRSRALAAKPGDPMQVRLTLPDGTEVETALTGFDQVQDVLDGEGALLASIYAMRHVDRDGAWRSGLTVCLPPSVPGPVGAVRPMRALPGLWHVRPLGAEDEVDVYVQRDDSIPGFRNGARPSRLVDEAYRDEAEGGMRLLSDPPDPGRIRRSGTVSAYATGRRQHRAGSSTTPDRRPEPMVPATGRDDVAYSGLDADGGRGGTLEVTETGPGRPGIPVRGTFAAGAGFGSGTSLAAPQAAARIADALAGGPPPQGPPPFVPRDY